MSPPSDPSPAPSLQQLLHELFNDAETLLLQQLSLLRAEFGEAIRSLMRGSIIMLIGLEIGIAGIVMLIGALIVGIAQFMPLWTACLVTGIFTTAVALTLILLARRELRRADFVPRRSGRVLRETMDWFGDELT